LHPENLLKNIVIDQAGDHPADKRIDLKTAGCKSKEIDYITENGLCF